MEINNKYVIKGVYIPTGDIYWGCANGGWRKQIKFAKIFSSSGAGNRVNSMNYNTNWDAKKIPVAIKILEEK